MSQLKTKVWDSYTRIYHLSQLVLLALLWYSAEEGDFENHFLYGFILLGLVFSRIVWGVIGSQNSRFVEFIKMPWQLPSLYRKKQLFVKESGHAPMAGYMVLALLLSLIVQLTSGLFTTDDVLAEGPLMYSVSEELAYWFDEIHSLNFDILLILIGLHIFAAVVHLALKHKVIFSIFTGTSVVSSDVKRYWRASYIGILIWLISSGLAYYFLFDQASF
ncbi:cytochrome b/b6 domain-containing protein [Algibacillus agarilyticus]|uniref:cytochrome b/b6 domain-containing protein n=1 Tax=Algibacillus agarilyticus TaxID=2234133 RepID=UPI000DCFEC63|nr:cytochrome b/b6 domain-containing protein [Algibacillus agarilyticus]